MAGPDRGPRTPTRNVYVVETAGDLPSVLSDWVIYHLKYDPGDGAGFYVTLDGTTLTKLGSDGGVAVSGTPANNQIAIWVDDETIEGDANLTWDGTILTIADGCVLRLEEGADVSISSTGHAFQIGETSSLNIAMDNNEIMARNNGAAGTLSFQSDGGNVNFGVLTPLTEFEVNAATFDCNATLDMTNQEIDFGSSTLGDKITLWGGYTLGIESSTMYFSAGGFYRWYNDETPDGGTSHCMELDGNGGLTTDTILTLRSSEAYAGIQIDGDTGNTTGEPGGAFVHLTQDGGAIEGGIAVVQSDTPWPGGPTCTSAANDLAIIFPDGQTCRFYEDGTSSQRGYVHNNGDIFAAGDLISASDIRVKEDIKPVLNALSKVRKLRGVTFRKTNSRDTRRHLGVIAQEIESIIPEVVTTEEDGYKSVAYANLTALLIEAVKELDGKIS